MRAYGFCVGILSTLMGIGGGLFSNLLMTFYGRPIHQAVATSSALAVLISIPGALGYIYAGWPAAARYPAVAALQFPVALGYVSLIGAVVVMPMSLVTAPLGVRAAHAMSKRALEVAFGCYLFIVGSRFVMSLVGGHNRRINLSIALRCVATYEGRQSLRSDRCRQVPSIVPRSFRN